MKNTKEKILEKAEELIREVGLNAMSYKDISEAVGIRKASIHHHFPKKEDLVNALLGKCHVLYGCSYETIADGSEPAPEKLKKIADIYLEGLKKNQLCIIGAMSSDINTLTEDTCHILEANIKSTISTFTKIFCQGEEEESLKFKGDAEDAAYAFFSFLLGAQIISRAEGGSEKFKDAVDLVIKSWES